MLRRNLTNGYTLVEMVVVIIIIGLLAIVAMRFWDRTTFLARISETRQEMVELAHAIVGQPELISGGCQTDYGYIGDVGALPRNWDDLIFNPGYSTWKGPYMYSRFLAPGQDLEFKFDAWGAAYSPPSNISFSSSGGPERITFRIAGSLDELFNNRVDLLVCDRNNVPPGSNHTDSVLIWLFIPDGAGGIRRLSSNPAPDGLVHFDSIPIGIHLLRTIFLTTGDTLISYINIEPGSNYYGEVRHYESIW